jgi:hypothetical protein
MLIFSLPAAAEIYEGFDMPGPADSFLGEKGNTAGSSSKGWMSTWQASIGKALFNEADLEIEGLESTPGSLRLRGQQMEKHIGKSAIMRQIGKNYTGDVYGSFRFSTGRLLDESTIALLIAVPGKATPTPADSVFAFSPKRWGAEQGMIKSGKKVSKILSGEMCEADATYQVLWKLENLPAAGERQNIKMKMWILNAAQATHFAKNNFKQSELNLAEEGTESHQICQRTTSSLADSKRTILKGMVVTLFSYSTPKLVFDEVRISADGF